MANKMYGADGQLYNVTQHGAEAVISASMLSYQETVHYASRSMLSIDDLMASADVCSDPILPPPDTCPPH